VFPLRQGPDLILESVQRLLRRNGVEMASYENLPALDRLGREETRLKVSQYLAKLSTPGHRDAEELTFYGLTYLRILHEGPSTPAIIQSSLSNA
jgi:hypothetical protein